MLDTTEEMVHLVVNTQGWTKGLGADLLTEIHGMIGQVAEGRSCNVKIFDFATSVPQFGHTTSEIPLPLGSTDAAQVIPLQPIHLPEYGPPKLTPADLRTLGLVSYLHLRPESFFSQAEAHWNFETSLVQRRPYEVPWSTFTRIDLLGTENIVRDEVLRALDVSLVALIEIQEEEGHSKEQLGHALRYAPGEGAATPASSTCLGLGIIRSIDSSSSTFHILSPLPASSLDRVNALQKGEIELPTVLMVDYATPADQEDGVCGIEWSRVPYLEKRGDALQGVGSGRRRVRRNVMRRSQMH